MTHWSRGSAEATVAPAPGGSRSGGRYEVLEPIERPGGFAAYKARHVLLDSLRVLTALPDEVVRDPQRLARVRAAVRAASSLRHERIVPVLDLIEDDGRYFVVESFVEGARLDRVLATRPFDAADALQIGRQLAEALAYAHATGVVHGTVCPANVLIEKGSPPRVWLSGFVLAALARSRGPIAAPFLPYSAPERVTGQAPTAGVDVFAVGQMLFELFERRPFFVGGRDAIEAELRDGSGPLLPRFSHVVPAGIVAVVARAIRRSAAERQQEMADVRADLDACVSAPGERGAGTPAESPVRPPAVAVRVDRARAARAPRAARIADRARAARRPLPSVERRAPATVPPHGDARGRSLWPAREQREATFPSRILVRAEPPRRTTVGGKLFVAGAVIGLGWALWPAVTPVSRVSVGPELARAVPASRVLVPPVEDPHVLPVTQATALQMAPVPPGDDEGGGSACLLDGDRMSIDPDSRGVPPAAPRRSTHAGGLAGPRVAGRKATKTPPPAAGRAGTRGRGTRRPGIALPRHR